MTLRPQKSDFVPGFMKYTPDLEDNYIKSRMSNCQDKESNEEKSDEYGSEELDDTRYKVNAGITKKPSIFRSFREKLEPIVELSELDKSEHENLPQHSRLEFLQIKKSKTCDMNVSMESLKLNKNYQSEILQPKVFDSNDIEESAGKTDENNQQNFKNSEIFFGPLDTQNSDNFENNAEDFDNSDYFSPIQDNVDEPNQYIHTDKSIIQETGPMEK